MIHLGLKTYPKRNVPGREAMDNRIFTKPAMVQSSVRLSRPAAELVLQAARALGQSRSEFLRAAAVERARRVIKKRQREKQLGN